MSYNFADPINLDPRLKFNFRMMTTRNIGGKNLFGTWEEETEPPSEDAIKVFLRVKPSNTDDNIIKILDRRTILFKMPVESMKSRRRLNIPDEYKYTFTNIYNPDVTQSEIFSGCVAPLIKDVFAGQHCLLFSYGTTNAGKTFTVLGTGDKPGILPRTLTTVFKTISGKQYNNARITPHMFNSALEITESTLREELSFKQNILNSNWTNDKTQTELSRLCKTNATAGTSTDEIISESVFREMQKRLTNDTSIVEHDAEPEDRFSVWISFAEIYNEAIFDLLEPVVSKGKRRQLKLAQDNSRNMYIKGLRHIFVQSEEEAYKVLMFGKNNLHVAATGMNSRSSRSHCIFTIKLMKWTNVEQPESVSVSSISICDLAGAERQKKTLNVGLRLKESQNINCSLHVLSRCFTTIRENQLNNENKIVPFRDSKLTHLFQHALQGKEAVSMIVNVNPEPHLCEETQHVLKASAIAKHIVVQPRSVHRPNRVTRISIFTEIVSRHKRSASIRWDSCVKSGAVDGKLLTIEDSQITENKPSERKEKQENYETLLSLVESLREKLKEEKYNHLQTKRTMKAREEEIREEMKGELEHLLKNAKEQNELVNKRAKDVGVAEGSGCQYNIPEKRTKRKAEERDTFNLPDEIPELKEEIKIQQNEIDGLKDLVNIMQEEMKDLTMELTSAKLKLGWKDTEINNLKAKIEMFGEESDMAKKYLALENDMEKKLKVRDNLLDEARNDFLEELRMKEEAIEDIEKLESEISDKDYEIATLHSEIEDLKQEVTAKASALEMMQQNIESMESTFDYDIKELERQCNTFEKELANKNNQIEQLTQQMMDGDEDHQQQVATLRANIEQVSSEKNILEERFYKQTLDFEEFKGESEKNLESTKRAAQDLKHSLEEKSSKIKELENRVRSIQLDRAKLNNQHLSEVSILEQSLKQQIQETDNQRSLQTEMEKEIERLNNDLSKVKSVCEDLRRALNNKEHDLECNKSKMAAYDNMLPTLQAELNHQRKETAEYKRRCDDQVATVFNMEQEMTSFQANQKEIIGKYEDQLKKAKDENETLKKEVARLTTTFYKSSTPTPKKYLEKENEDLKRVNEDLVKLLEDLKVTCQTLQEAEEQVLKPQAKFRARAESTSSEPINTRADFQKISSASKAIPRRTRTTTGVLTTGTINLDKEERKLNEKQQKQARKKLWDARAHDETDVQFDNIEVNMSAPQDSPGTVVRKTLRNRKR